MNSALYSLRTNSDENTAVVENIQEPSISSSAYNCRIGESSIPYCGVDWSATAQSTNHCWFLLPSRKSYSRNVCKYPECITIQSRKDTSLVQCGCCMLIVHESHLLEESERQNLFKNIRKCRSSFTENSLVIDDTYLDQHAWSNVPSLKQPCMFCGRKRSLQSHIKRTQAYTVSIPDQNPCEYVHTSNNNFSSNYFICLWCSRYSHGSCLKNVDRNREIKCECDYGRFRNIIVRPQWLYRMSNDDQTRFYAEDKNSLLPEFSTCTPLIILINKLSGGQQGSRLYRKLLRILNPRQIFLIDSSESIYNALSIYKSLKNIRICACGGDGTVNWILSIIVDHFSSSIMPPVCICPLGTGNDLSRVLGWGWTFNQKKLNSTLIAMSTAHPRLLDRWQINIKRLPLNQVTEELPRNHRWLSCFLEHPQFVRDRYASIYEKYHAPVNNRFTNYLSFGLDGAVVLDFHDRRLRDSSRFTSPFKNKLLYLNISRTYVKEFLFWRSWDLSPYMQLTCDGTDMTHMLQNCHTIVLLNIPSYGSGARPWGSFRSNIDADNIGSVTTIEQTIQSVSSNLSVNGDVNECKRHSRVKPNSFSDQNFGDGKFEIVGLDCVQMAFIHVGCRGRRIGQGRHVRILLKRPMPVHMDGEPFCLPEKSIIDINHAGQVWMLNKISPTNN